MGISIAHLIYGPAVIAAIAYATVQAHAMLDVAWSTAYLIAVNVVAFAFYAFDKIFVRLLNTLRLRVPEDVLVWLLAFPGGIVGAIFAMYTLQLNPDGLVRQSSGCHRRTAHTAYTSSSALAVFST